MMKIYVPKKKIRIDGKNPDMLLSVIANNTPFDPEMLEEWLLELQEYKNTGLTPEEIQQKLEELAHYKQLEADGRFTKCCDCELLRIQNKSEIYADCAYSGHVFYQFEEDTRECGCTWGKQKQALKDGGAND